MAISDLAGVTPIHLHFNYENGQRRILAEVAGPNPVSPQNAALVQDRVINEIGSDTEINLWYRNEFVVNDAGYSTYEELTDPQLLQRRKVLQEIFGTDQGVFANMTKDVPSGDIETAVSMVDN
jgi:hypothetical protein